MYIFLGWLLVYGVTATALLAAFEALIVHDHADFIIIWVTFHKARKCVRLFMLLESVIKQN